MEKEKDTIVSSEVLDQVTGGACPRVLEPLIGDTTEFIPPVQGTVENVIKNVETAIKK